MLTIALLTFVAAAPAPPAPKALTVRHELSGLTVELTPLPAKWVRQKRSPEWVAAEWRDGDALMRVQIVDYRSFLGDDADEELSAHRKRLLVLAKIATLSEHRATREEFSFDASAPFESKLSVAKRDIDALSTRMMWSKNEGARLRRIDAACALSGARVILLIGASARVTSKEEIRAFDATFDAMWKSMAVK